METLAFLHWAVDYENPEFALEVRSLQELLPSPAIVGAMAIGVAVISQSPAQALMRYGDAGRGVADLQAQLNIGADGIYGQQTYQRVRSFQADRGIQIDGVAGPATLSALGLNANLAAADGIGGPVPVSTPNNSAVVTSRIGLIIRDRPNGYDIGSVGRGERVSLTGDRQSAGGRSWVQLSQGGWIAADYISYSGTGNDSEIPVGTQPYVSSRIGLIVRDRPNGYNIGGLASGQSIALTGASQSAGGRSWVQLSQGGWVAEEYVAYR